MRASVEIDEGLLAEVEEIAAERGCSATDIIEGAVRESLSTRRTVARRERVVLPVFHGTGLQPGVNLDNSAALLDLMEEDDTTP